MLNTLSEHLEQRAEVRGGKPCLRGTRLAIADIALLHFQLGQSLEQIAGHYDVSLASLHAAMAYYYDHQDEINAAAAEERELIESLRRNHSSLLQEKIRTEPGSGTDSLLS